MSLAIVPVSVAVCSSYPANEQHYHQMECECKVAQFNMISNLLCCRFSKCLLKKALFNWGIRHSPVLYNQFSSPFLVLLSDMSLGLLYCRDYLVPY